MLETARLRMLPWQPDDWLLLRPIATDREVVRYISNGEPWPDERIREWATRQVKHFSKYGFCFWKLIHKGTGQMIGFCGLQPLENTQEIEIGWWLARAWWGQGYATEAAREAMRDGFERAGLRRIVSIAIRENVASTHIMEKLGMEYEKETTHRNVPVVMYAVDNPKNTEAKIRP
jgi:[ribosomal protein S5]-alanine N-acetyltransferase